MAKRINGPLKWVAIIITLLGIFAGTIWNAATLHNDVGHLKEAVEKINQKLDKHLIEHRNIY